MNRRKTSSSSSKVVVPSNINIYPRRGDIKIKVCTGLQDAFRDTRQKEKVNAFPEDLSLTLLKRITNEFSDKLLLGEGSFGSVYKGVFENGHIIAVKKLNRLKSGDHKDEVNHLRMLSHPNLVQIIDCCYETRRGFFEQNGDLVLSEAQYGFICSEYLPNGSLEGYLSDEFCGLDWHIRYNIIKGICCGLHYLHGKCQYQSKASIVHLDLKPKNILLDSHMVPKIVDFGISNLIDNAHRSQTCSTTFPESLSYMAPEYVYGCINTSKADIYSLGVIIMEIISGRKINPFNLDTATACKNFIELVVKNWRQRLEAESSSASWCQIEFCLKIALRCITINRNKRPTMIDIIEWLNTRESDNFGAIKEQKPIADPVVSALQDGSSTPQKLPLECLRHITNGFSDKRLLGQGGFGKVYKGVLPNGQMVAVKKLNQFKPGVHDKQFENEVRHLIKLKHPNIVRLVGYCYETQNQYMTYDEKGIFAEIQERLLCLEFLSNGSLDKHISDECSGLDWHTRYKIIQGICFGLHYLHEECLSEINATIVHLDLKPANILLGYDMVPKIADFGLSKLFCDTKTQTYATSLMGSHGYMAPEYILDNKITTAADMYSLGIIIIEIITGSKVHFSLESSRQDIVDFIESALEKWTSRQEASELCENHYHQIKFCLEIGIRCIEFDPMERPNIRDVYNEFNKWLSIKPEVNGSMHAEAEFILH